MVTFEIILIIEAVLSRFWYVDVLCGCTVGFSLVMVWFQYGLSLFVDENHSVCRLYLPTFYTIRTFAVL